jgi:spermidine synthase
LLLQAGLPASQRRIGVVGLGTGTLAVYGRVGDLFRFYEINPAVRQVADTEFSFLKNCPAQVEVVMGDARLALEREPPQRFDLLALDAFSSDAIPVHLLTVEAFQVYLAHLKPEGVLAVHISNRHLNLLPVINNVAARYQLRQANIVYRGQPGLSWKCPSQWVLLTRSERLLQTEAIADAARSSRSTGATVPLWTDDYASVLRLLK